MSENVELKYRYYKTFCNGCVAPILVEIVYEKGTMPNVEVQSTCQKCLLENEMNVDFVEQYPEIAKDIDEFIGRKQDGTKNET